MKRGFTLIEVLVVLILMGIVFSTLLIVFSRGIDSSLSISEDSEFLKRKVLLFWDFQRKILGAKKILLKKGNLFMITSGGSIYQGIVKCAYIYRDGKLYYYEFPYPYGAIEEYEEDKLQEIGRYKGWRVVAVVGKREFKSYEGLPNKVRVYVDDEMFIFDTLQRTPLKFHGP